MTMEAREFRDLTIEELNEKHRLYKEELFNLRFQNAIGQLKNSSRINVVKKTIARVLTVVREKQMAGEQSAGRR